MPQRTLVLGWGDEKVHEAIETLRHEGWNAELLDGGFMAPHLLPHLKWHEHVLLLTIGSLSGLEGNVYRFRGKDLDKLRAVGGWHEAAVEMELHDRQPHDLMVILAEPGKNAAADLAQAAQRQLRLWESGAA